MGSGRGDEERRGDEPAGRSRLLSPGYEGNPLTAARGGSHDPPGRRRPYHARWAALADLDPQGFARQGRARPIPRPEPRPRLLREALKRGGFGAYRLGHPPRLPGDRVRLAIA